MHNSASLVSAMKTALVMLLVLDTGLEAAPTRRGFEKPPHPHSSLTHSPALPERPSALNPSQYLRHWLLTTKAAGLDRTARITDRAAAGTITGSGQTGIGTGTGTEPGQDHRAQMLKMISALEELSRTFNSTLSSRITVMTRGTDAMKRNGRNSGRKNKGAKLPADGRGVKPTTLPPAATDSTASRASADVVIPRLTGRNFTKSLPPQTKKTNKRVCFWKYCSQN